MDIEGSKQSSTSLGTVVGKYANGVSPGEPGPNDGDSPGSPRVTGVYNMYGMVLYGVLAVHIQLHTRRLYMDMLVYVG
jgi:hypothetical protein